MVNVAAAGGGGYRPVHHAAPHRGRPPALHHATFMVFRRGGPGLPRIPAKYRPKPKPHPKPAPLRLPTIGKGKTAPGNLAVPVFGGAAFQQALQRQKTIASRVSIPHPGQPPSPYVNPFAGANVTPARIDMGVDYFGRGNIGAIGPGVITASGNAWQGAVGAPNPGTWITEKLSAGPLKGQQVYVAEDVSSLVKTGQTVKAGQPIGQFVAGSGGVQYAIETGIAAPGAAGRGGQTMADYAGQAAAGGDPGARSTAWGVTFSNLLSRLGAPAGILTPGGITGTAPSFSPGGKVALQPRHMLPPAPLPNTTPHGVNPPASGGVNLGPVDFMAFDTTIRRRGGGGGSPPPTRNFDNDFGRRHGPGTGGPPTRQPGGPTPTGAGGRGPGPTVTTITSSRGKGGVMSFAAPSTGASSSGGTSTLLLVAGAGVVLVILLMRKGKGKGLGKK